MKGGPSQQLLGTLPLHEFYELGLQFKIIFSSQNFYLNPICSFFGYVGDIITIYGDYGHLGNHYSEVYHYFQEYSTFQKCYYGHGRQRITEELSQAGGDYGDITI